MNAAPLTLITGAEVYTPEPRGRLQVLIGGGRILAMAERVDIGGTAVKVVDAGGQWLLPGLVDALTHPCGGGGEGGFGNRTAEVPASDFIRAGVTTPVGALGTDSLARSHEVLFGKVMELRARGLDGLMYTGAYRVPAPTLTGDVARDIALLEPVIGVGEVAISDHRSAQPTAAELRRLAADASLGGTLRGRGGTVLLHLGDGPRGLAPAREALAGSELPVTAFYPTHVNRNRALLADAIDFAREGGFIDITVATTPELVAAGDIPPLEALQRALDAGVPARQLTLSSDAGGSLPLYLDGELQGLTAASPGVLLDCLRQALREAPGLVETVIAALTLNPARALRLPEAGRLAAGGPASLLLLDPRSGALTAVHAGGRWLLRDGAVQEADIG